MTATPDPRMVGFVAEHHWGVLVTIKRDGRPQLSNVGYFMDAGSGLIRVSVTADRAKTRNLEADPRVGLHVTSKDFWTWVVVEGTAELTPVAAEPDDATVEELVAYYRGINGEHPDWEDYRAAMVRDRRRVVRFSVEHAYGQLRGRAAGSCPAAPSRSVSPSAPPLRRRRRPRGPRRRRTAR